MSNGYTLPFRVYVFGGSIWTLRAAFDVLTEAADFALQLKARKTEIRHANKHGVETGIVWQGKEVKRIAS